jgi:RING-H2 zinc finger domain
MQSYLEGIEVASGLPVNATGRSKVEERGVNQSTINQSLCVFSLNEGAPRSKSSEPDPGGLKERLFTVSGCEICGKESKDIAYSRQSDACSICLNAFAEEPAICTGDDETGKLRVLPCQHIFHKQCVDAWLHRRNACPLCNAIPCM